jgi:hypothetical protein
MMIGHENVESSVAGDSYVTTTGDLMVLVGWRPD